MAHERFSSSAARLPQPDEVDEPIGSAHPLDQPPRVLAIDDNEVNRRLLSLMLENAGCRVDVAADGDSGLRRAQEARPDLILLDVMMPDKDGFQVCREMRALPSLRHVPIIFLSALTETKDKVKGLAAGGVDYITKPFDRSEVLARVRSQIEIGRLTREIVSKNGELLRRQACLDTDLKAAAVIQHALLPTATRQIEGVRCAWRFTPCQSVGGDIFNFFPVDSEHLVMYMLDVSGHGVTSAMVTVCLSQTLSPSSGTFWIEEAGKKRWAQPAEVLDLLEEQYPIERFDRYFTMAYLVLNLRTGTLVSSCAGHPPPVLLRTDGTIESLTAGGPLIGLGRSPTFRQQVVQIHDGDRLFLYTDGVTELENRRGEAYGEDEFYRLLMRSRELELEESCDRVIGSMHRFAEGLAPRDDVSLLALELTGRPDGNQSLAEGKTN
jgi:sigma-B regulation protein RsbU (phosphoserine phosphatase)